MVTRHQHDGVTWVDLESPTREELAHVMNEFEIDDRVEEEIISPTPYPLIAVAPSYVYLILHFPTTDPRGGARNQEIDFVIGKDFLITVRYELVSTIHTLHRVFESEALMNGKRKHSPAALIERLLRQLYATITDNAETVGRQLERIEEDIFVGREQLMVRSISLAARVLLRFDITLTRHHDPLREFLDELTTDRFFGTSFKESIVRIEAERAHAAAVVTSYRQMMMELRRTNDSLLSTNQNEIMKRLTIMTFVAVPLTVITGLFGMNAEIMPIVDSPNAFWIILFIMLVALSSLLVYFRRKKWL